MRFGKKAVSPLIATIMLIALTVGIGAIIIGWGKSYVERQTGCMGYSAEIYDARYNDTAWNNNNNYLNNLTLKVSNTGSNTIKIDDNRFFVVIIDANGAKHLCGKKELTNTDEGCFVNTSLSSKELKPSDVYTKIIVHINGSTDVGKKWNTSVAGGQVYLMIKGCGRISPQVMIS